MSTMSLESALRRHADALARGRELAAANATALMSLIAGKLGVSQGRHRTELDKRTDSLALLRLAKSNEAAFAIV